MSSNTKRHPNALTSVVEHLKAATHSGRVASTLPVYQWYQCNKFQYYNLWNNEDRHMEQFVPPTAEAGAMLQV